MIQYLFPFLEIFSTLAVQRWVRRQFYFYDFTIFLFDIRNRFLL